MSKPVQPVSNRIEPLKFSTARRALDLTHKIGGALGGGFLGVMLFSSVESPAVLTMTAGFLATSALAKSIGELFLDRSAHRAFYDNLSEPEKAYRKLGELSQSQGDAITQDLGIVIGAACKADTDGTFELAREMGLKNFEKDHLITLLLPQAKLSKKVQAFIFDLLDTDDIQKPTDLADLERTLMAANEDFRARVWSFLFTLFLDKSDKGEETFASLAPEVVNRVSDTDTLLEMADLAIERRYIAIAQNVLTKLEGKVDKRVIAQRMTDVTEIQLNLARVLDAINSGTKITNSDKRHALELVPQARREELELQIDSPPSRNSGNAIERIALKHSGQLPPVKPPLPPADTPKEEKPAEAPEGPPTVQKPPVSNEELEEAQKMAAAAPSAGPATSQLPKMSTDPRIVSLHWSGISQDEVTLIPILVNAAKGFLTPTQMTQGDQTDTVIKLIKEADEQLQSVLEGWAITYAVSQGFDAEATDQLNATIKNLFAHQVPTAPTRASQSTPPPKPSIKETTQQPPDPDLLKMSSEEAGPQAAKTKQQAPVDSAWDRVISKVGKKKKPDLFKIGIALKSSGQFATLEDLNKQPLLNALAEILLDMSEDTYDQIIDLGLADDQMELVNELYFEEA